MNPDLFGGWDDCCHHHIHWSASEMDRHLEVVDAHLRRQAAQMRADAEARAAADVVAEAEAILREAAEEA